MVVDLRTFELSGVNKSVQVWIKQTLSFIFSGKNIDKQIIELQSAVNFKLLFLRKLVVFQELSLKLYPNYCVGGKHSYIQTLYSILYLCTTSESEFLLYFYVLLIISKYFVATIYSWDVYCAHDHCWEDTNFADNLKIIL